MTFATTFLQSKSGSCDAWFLKGKIEQIRVSCIHADAKNNYNAAFESFQKAYALKPDVAHVKYAYGQMLLYKGSRDKAADVFKSILEKDSLNYQVIKVR